MTNHTLDQLQTVIAPYQPTDLVAMLRPSDAALGNAPWNTFVAQVQAAMGLALLPDLGAVNAYVLTPTPAATAYLAGQVYLWTVGATNTLASTLNVSGLGAKPIIRPDGHALQAGDLLAAEVVLTIYTGSAFQLLTALTALTKPPKDNSVAPASTAYVDAAVAAGVPGAYAFRNRLINGDMQIDQRHAGGAQAVTNAQAFIVDRWKVAVFGTVGAANVAQTAINWPTTTPSSTAIQISTTTAKAVLGSGDLVEFFQNVEGLQLSDLGWGTVNAQAVAVSFCCAASVGGDYHVSLCDGASALSYVHKVTLVAGQTTRVAFSVPGPTTGTWPITNAMCLSLRTCMGAGSTWQTAVLDAWQAGNFLGGPTQVNMLAANGNGFWLTDVQFEVGTVATPFERRPIDIELIRCKRYYWKTYDYSTQPGTNNAPGYESRPLILINNTNAASLRHPVKMRAAPAVIFYSFLASVVGSWEVFGATTVAITLQNSLTESLNFYNAAGPASATFMYGHITCDAEF